LDIVAKRANARRPQAVPSLQKRIRTGDGDSMKYVKHLSLLSLCLPAVFLILAWLLLSKFPEAFILVFLLLYFITIVGFFVFAEHKPYPVWLLPISFIISPLPIFACENAAVNALDEIFGFVYLGTILSTVYYAIPLFIASLIIAIVLQCKKRPNKNKKEEHG